MEKLGKARVYINSRRHLQANNGLGTRPSLGRGAEGVK